MRASYTYAELQADANRLSNALAARRAARRPGGDRPAAAFETAVAHIALYRLGAVAMPLSMLFGPDALEYRINDSGAVAAIVDDARGQR